MKTLHTEDIDTSVVSRAAKEVSASHYTVYTAYIDRKNKDVIFVAS